MNTRGDILFYCDYPIIGEEKNLPLYIINMGLQHCQEPISRKNGYPCDQILFCTRGSGTLIINQTTYLIPAYTAIFLPANYPHEYFPNEEIWDIHWIVPGGNSLPSLLSHFNLTTAAVYKLSETHILETIFRSMHEALRSDSLYGNYRASGYLYDFLLEFNRLISHKDTATVHNSALIKAIDYINLHFLETIGMDELCDECKVTKQHLCLLFRTSLQMRPMEYITKKKLQYSKELLINSTRTIEDIAYECGFCTPSYYCKMFKRYEGISPTQFKRTMAD